MSVKDPNPLNRPFVWSLSASGTVIDTNYYYEITPDGEVLAQITNHSGSPLGGFKRRQSDITMSVKCNLADSPFFIATTFVNFTNANVWANGPPRTWLCTGVSAQQQSEIVGDEVIEYWSAGFNFAYRAETWAAQYVDVQNPHLPTLYFNLYRSTDFASQFGNPPT